MRFGSKRGAALAIVIVVSAALLILAAALVSVAQFNLSYAQNSLESRQAYLDAKSAIEYGKAYVTKNPTTGDFTVNGSSGSGFTIVKVPDATKVTFDANVIASYVNATKLLSAAGKYKSSERFRKLGYQFATKSGGGNANLNFLICGAAYGSNTVIDNFYYPELINDRESDYPVIIKRGLEITSGWNSPRELTAPQIYIMCENSNNKSLFGYGTYGKLKSDFIYIAGNIAGQDYRGNISELTQNYTKLLLETNNESKGVICFGQDCHIIVAGNQANGDGSGTRDILIKKGAYNFNDQTDLFDIDIKNKLSGINLPSDTQTKINSVTTNIDAMVCGDSWDKSQGTLWTLDGALKDGLCSIESGNGEKIWVFDYVCAGVKKIVYLYVNNCSNWDRNTSIWRANQALYIAKEINMQYVNDSSDFTVPASKTVIFQADNISLNTQASDTEVGDNPDIVDGGSSKFIMQSTDGTKGFNLTFPNDITVNYSGSKSYSIPTGTYHIDKGFGVSGIGINLFSDQAKTYFATAVSDPVSGSTGGSGGISVTGGTYTDG